MIPPTFGRRRPRRPTLRERLLAAYEDGLDDAYFARRRFGSHAEGGQLPPPRETDDVRVELSAGGPLTEEVSRDQ
jgi:hypothetical protein